MTTLIIYMDRQIGFIILISPFLLISFLPGFQASVKKTTTQPIKEYQTLIAYIIYIYIILTGDYMILSHQTSTEMRL